MLGSTPLERARVREAERICELGVLSTVGTVFQNTSPFFAGRIKQSPDAAETARGRLTDVTSVVDRMIASKPFVAGDRPTIADCTLFAALEFAAFGGIDVGLAERSNLARWYQAFKQRPSAGA